MTASSGVDYAAAIALDRLPGSAARKAILWTSLATNLGFLFTFKYFSTLTHLNEEGRQLFTEQLADVLPRWSAAGTR